MRTTSGGIYEEMRLKVCGTRFDPSRKIIKMLLCRRELARIFHITNSKKYIRLYGRYINQHFIGMG